VRGFRIEIGEIEARLNDYAKIKEGAIVAREDIPGDVRLVGYIVPSDGILNEDGKFDSEELKTHLRASLPEYMVPQIFVTMDELPLSPSGKVDKRSLPAPDLDRSSLKSAYVAPTNKTEFELVRISEELLGIDHIGINDNFFELGGHSLLATQFISRIRDELGVELELRQLFETPTAAQLATFVDSKLVTSIDYRTRIGELIARINELSDEEVQELLELKRKNDS
jgi:acyl carrier protein